jgi:hypothetical protein
MPDLNALMSQAQTGGLQGLSTSPLANRDSSWMSRYGTTPQQVAAMNNMNLPNQQMQGQQMQQGNPQMMQQPEQIAIAINPLEVLRAKSEAQKKELSLQTLTKKQKDKILKSFQNGRDIANKHYTNTIEPMVLHRREIHDATIEHYKKKFAILSESSNWVSKDVKTSCDWILPGLMEAFTGSDDPISVKGVNVEDDQTAEKIQQLVRYQLEKKNDYHQFMLSTLKQALSENYAVAKVYWKRTEKRKRMKMLLDLNDEVTSAAIMQLIDSEKIEIEEAEEIPEAPDLIKLEYDEVTVTANHPVVEYIPSSELRFTPDAPVLQDCKFVAHRKVVRGDYLKRKELEGIYKDVDKAIEEFGTGDTSRTYLEEVNSPDRQDIQKTLLSDSDNASKEVELYEAYLMVDYNDDGVYEKLIVHAVGNHLLRVVENDFEFPPFFICSAFYDSNNVFSRESFSDNLEQLQDLKTALMRQIIINVSKNNSPRVFVDERKVDMDALMANEEIIPTQGDPSQCIVNPPSLPLSSISMEVINYAQSEIESQSGSTRYNQGLDSSSLNDTATGITAILGASEKRNKLIARSIAERFVIPIFRFIVLLNQLYADDEQIIRLTNVNVPIRKEELDIDYDLIINVGQGAGTREAQIQYLMLVLNQIYPQLAQQGIANAKSWYNLVCKLLETLGLRDVTAYLLDPESEEAKQALQQAQQAAAQQQAEALYNSLQLSLAKSSVPRFNINLTDLPEGAQKQYLEKTLGITTTERAIAEHEELVNGD